MIVYDLVCEHDHPFEGWFDSLDAFDSQQASGALSCPLCASVTVVRRPSAPYLNVKAQSGNEQTAVAMAHNMTPEMMLAKMMAYIKQHTDDVGRAFPEEARKIYYGEAEARGIRGQASQAEVAELSEEGIDVLAIPGMPLLPDKLQ